VKFWRFERNLNFVGMIDTTDHLCYVVKWIMEFELVLNIWYWLNELVWLYLRSYDNSSSNIRDMNKFNYMWLAFIICGPSSLLIFITYPEFLEPDTI